MPEAICVIYDNKGTCKQVGIYDGGRICGYHWARIDKTVLNASQGFDTVTYRCGLDNGPPYSVWKAPTQTWWAVCDRMGYNVIRFRDKPGAVFTDVLNAIATADLWNGKDLI